MFHLFVRPARYRGRLFLVNSNGTSRQLSLLFFRFLDRKA